MKTFIILSLSIISLNTFAGTVGEDKKGECIYSNQSATREAKKIEAPVQGPKKEEVKTKSI